MKLLVDIHDNEEVKHGEKKTLYDKVMLYL